MAKSPEVPVVFDLPVSLGGWKSLLVIAADQLASRVELFHPNCMDGLLVASGNRSPNLWCMKLSRTGGRNPSVVSDFLETDFSLVGATRASEIPMDQSNFDALATTCGEGFLFPTWTCFFTRPSFDPRRHYKLKNKHLPLNPVTVPSYSHVCWLSVVRHHHNQLRHRSKLSWITYLGWPRSVRRVVSRKDAGATRVSGTTVMVEAVILQENAGEVLDENTSTQFLMIFLLNSTTVCNLYAILRPSSAFYGIFINGSKRAVCWGYCSCWQSGPKVKVALPLPGSASGSQVSNEKMGPLVV